MLAKIGRKPFLPEQDAEDVLQDLFVVDDEDVHADAGASLDAGGQLDREAAARSGQVLRLDPPAVVLDDRRG